MDIKNPMRLICIGCINVVWPYSRLYCFYYLIKAAVNGVANTRSFKHEDVMIYHYMIDFNLIALYILHVYWEYRFIELIVGAYIFGKREDTVEPRKKEISEMKINKVKSQ